MHEDESQKKIFLLPTSLHDSFVNSSKYNSDVPWIKSYDGDASIFINLITSPVARRVGNKHFIGYQPSCEEVSATLTVFYSSSNMHKVTNDSGICR
eukprot:2268126-Ditylum_brightwellii.AAC.1